MGHSTSSERRCPTICCGNTASSKATGGGQRFSTSWIQVTAARDKTGTERLLSMIILDSRSKWLFCWICLILQVLVLDNLVVVARRPKLDQPGVYHLDSRPEDSSRITFGRIDPIGDECVMVYGNLSFGGEGFLIKDCGKQRWKTAGRISIGYLDKMLFLGKSSAWFIVRGELVKIRGDDNLFEVFEKKKSDGRLNDVFFIDRQVGWVCGNDGLIQATTDGGSTWRTINSNTDIDLQTIRFISPYEGWVHGREYKSGRVVTVTLITRDGGRSWATLKMLRELSPVFLTGLLKGCGVDEESEIVCTRDGEFWETFESDKGSPGSKHSIYFLNQHVGWIIGDSVWQTKNGGRTWTEQLTIPEHSSLVLKGVVFVNEKLGWAYTLTTVWRTNDGGLTWTRISDAWIARLKAGWPSLHGRPPLAPSQKP
jgi:photosystem II stability/assembly factor-like uncharacterized protein